MALTSAPYGLVPINLLGGQGFAGSTRLYSIPSGYAVNIQTGDPVIITNTGSTRGTIARMNATATATTVTSTGGGFGFVGVFVGCTYTDPVFGKIFRQTYVSGTVASDIQAYVVIVDYVTIGDAFTDVVVRINTHFHRSGNTGIAGTAAS